MRKGWLAVGVGLIITGFVITGFFYTPWSEFRSPLGQMARALEPDAQRAYMTLTGLVVIGGGILIGGIASTLYGIFAKSEEIRGETEKRIKLIPICPHCGARVPLNSKFCPECGAKLHPEK